MNINIVTELPLWLTVFCLLVGLVYATVLYYKEQKLDDLRKGILYLLFSLRFFLVFILSFLLLSPLLKTIFRELEDPIIVFAQDNSSSLSFGKDSSFYKNTYHQEVQQLIAELKKDFDVRTYIFGEKVEQRNDFDFSHKQTDLSEFFEELNTRFVNRNVGAVIVASDGLYNRGENPVYATANLTFPLYTIALGDTAVQKDLILYKVAHNRMGFLGNQFPMEVIIKAKDLQGKKTKIVIEHKGNTVFMQDVFISNNAFSISVPLHLLAEEIGMQRYRVKLQELEGEVTYANNSQDIFIDVLDSRQKILLLTNAPHPDIAALKQAIEKNENYEVEVFKADNFVKPLKQYNLVIFHKSSSYIPSNRKIISEIASKNIPMWMINGDLQAGIDFGLKINVSNAMQNESESVLNENFNLFTLSDELRNFVQNFPAVNTPFATYQISPTANVLLNQKIGLVATQNPLVLFNEDGEIKTAYYVGEGIWKWRMRNFAENGNHLIFDELINKTVQYLSTKLDRSFFRVVAHRTFNENEAVEFEAEVYNESYELINDPEISINIINAEDKSFPFAFGKTDRAYHLNAGFFPAGVYRYEAKVKIGNKEYLEKGEFSINALQVELSNTVADHQLLYRLANKHGGKMLYPEQMASIKELLKQREDITSVSYSEQKYADMIHLKWIFYVILSLLSMEWFLRKRNGAY